ncbi:MAG: 2-oxoglutarate dehydrogenase complex dihydrolipoyllysine-residue succinyltransferase [Chlorobi bacterium]|nr:2-oxoglutarate dehydrogenase complex dihydrolipoyllysine-residue succinyltransferase [Chlorobiota bacterium]
MAGQKVIEVKVPSVGESVQEILISQWLVKDGDFVNEDEPVAELETDKATVEVPSPATGKIKILKPEGEVVNPGDVIATIEVVEGEVPTKPTEPEPKEKQPVAEEKTAEPKEEKPVEQPKEEPVQATAEKGGEEPKATPVAMRLMKEYGIDSSEVLGTGSGGKITKQDVINYIKQRLSEERSVTSVVAHQEFQSIPKGERTVVRKRLTPLRKALIKRLMNARHKTAMLTTFNEVDMTAIMEIRKKYKEAFKEKHGVKLGIMSFFTRACAIALMEFPQVNAQIDGDEVVYFNYADIGIAVATPRGLVVPVVRNAESKTLPELEREIDELARKGREGKLKPEDLEGGTFTITNGGVFGSLMSTPLLNYPQTAILGMHAIKQRPVAVNGKVEIRPMMYLALSYDHRLIDGADAVSFLVRVIELLQNPVMLIDGTDPIEKKLLLL